MSIIQFDVPSDYTPRPDLGLALLVDILLIGLLLFDLGTLGFLVSETKFVHFFILPIDLLVILNKLSEKFQSPYSDIGCKHETGSMNCVFENFITIIIFISSIYDKVVQFNK